MQSTDSSTLGSTITSTFTSTETSEVYTTPKSPYVLPYDCTNVKDNLNNDLAYCCSIPRLSVSSDVYFGCQNLCDKQNKQDDRCCMLTCCFDKIGVVVNKTFDIGYLRYSFMLYVYGDPVWSDVISDSVDTCYGRAIEENLMSNSTLDCDAIPFHTYRVIDCIYARNYENCPAIDWNLSENDYCDGTEDYVEKCLEWP